MWFGAHVVRWVRVPVISAFVNVDGPTLAGQLDKLLLEEPVVYACDQLGDKSK